jgi:hypothetical protein
VRLTVTPPGAERALVAPEVGMRRQSTPGGPPNLSAAVVSSYSEVVVRGPSAVVVHSNFSTRRRCVPDGGALGVDLTFTPAVADHPINIATTVPQSGQRTRPGSTLWLMEQTRPQERYHEGRMLPPVVD